MRAMHDATRLAIACSNRKRRSDHAFCTSSVHGNHRKRPEFGSRNARKRGIQYPQTGDAVDHVLQNTRQRGGRITPFVSSGRLVSALPRVTPGFKHYRQRPVERCRARPVVASLCRRPRKAERFGVAEPGVYHPVEGIMSAARHGRYDSARSIVVQCSCRVKPATFRAAYIRGRRRIAS